MIEFDRVTKYYRREKVLDNVSFVVPSGTQLGLIGPGGAGKSLLLKIAAGLEKPDEGDVRIDGRSVQTLNEVELADMRQSIGMLFQNYALFDFMTVEENIAFPLRQEGKATEAEIRARVDELLAQVDLPHAHLNYPNQLSGGMKKRVTFARAIVRKPPIVFYDDPTAGLDPVTSSKIFRMLQLNREQSGVTSIVITHDILGLKDICDHFCLIDKGRVVLHADRHELDTSSIRLVRQFWDGKLDA